jgi:hypothetical protein
MCPSYTRPDRPRVLFADSRLVATACCCRPPWPAATASTTWPPLRAGATAAVLGQRVAAPSTVGTFVRSFGWGDARQLDAVGRALLRPDVEASWKGPIRTSAG